MSTIQSIELTAEVFETFFSIKTNRKMSSKPVLQGPCSTAVCRSSRVSRTYPGRTNAPKDIITDATRRAGTDYLVWYVPTYHTCWRQLFCFVLRGLGYNSQTGQTIRSERLPKQSGHSSGLIFGSEHDPAGSSHPGIARVA